MSNPKFTAHIVLHYLPTEPSDESVHRNTTDDFALIRIHLNSNTPLYDALDEQASVVEAAQELVDDPAIRKTLKTGDYVSVSLAGELNFHSYTDFEGQTEYDMAVEPEWHHWCTLNAEERQAVNWQERAAGNGVPSEAGNLVYLD
jgi:hypothetical protein